MTAKRNRVMSHDKPEYVDDPPAWFLVFLVALLFFAFYAGLQVFIRVNKSGTNRDAVLTSAEVSPIMLALNARK